MKVKYLKKNLKLTKQYIKILAKEYKVKVKWKEDPKKPKIYLAFEKKVSQKHKYILCTSLPAEKIAYGLYKPMMVMYNTERKVQSWLRKMDDV